MISHKELLFSGVGVVFVITDFFFVWAIMMEHYMDNPTNAAVEMLTYLTLYNWKWKFSTMTFRVSTSRNVFMSSRSRMFYFTFPEHMEVKPIKGATAGPVFVSYAQQSWKGVYWNQIVRLCWHVADDCSLKKYFSYIFWWWRPSVRPSNPVTALLGAILFQGQTWVKISDEAVHGRRGLLYERLTK